MARCNEVLNVLLMVCPATDRYRTMEAMLDDWATDDSDVNLLRFSTITAGERIYVPEHAGGAASSSVPEPASCSATPPSPRSPMNLTADQLNLIQKRKAEALAKRDAKRQRAFEVDPKEESESL